MGQIIPNLPGDLLSPKLWQHIPVNEIQANPGAGIFIFDDFTNAGKFEISATAATTAYQGGYAAYALSAVTIQPVAAAGGVLRVSALNSDNDDAYVQAGGNSGSCIKISSSTGAVAFECRVRKSEVANNGISVFVGLAETGLCAADSLADDTGVVADKNHIGFSSIAADGDMFDFVWKADGQTAGGIADATAIVAATWLKLGFLYDPQAPETERITVFVDGEPLSTFGTKTNMDADTFPDDIYLTLTWLNKPGTASMGSEYVDLDWWAVGQVGRS